MSSGFWTVVLIVLAVVVYAAAQVRKYMRRSEQQWKEVDKSRLKSWDDDDW